MNRYVTAILLAVVCTGCAHGQRSADVGPGDTPKQLRDIIGVTHVNGQYYLTDKDFLNEGADQILALGSRVIKVWFDKPSDSYRFNSQWPKAGSMVEIAQSSYFRKLFDKPFTTYILMCFSMGRPGGYFRDGLTDEQKADEQKQFYELAKYLLTTYKGSGKTFVLQHWEGDWLIRGNFNKDVDPEPRAIQGMIDWLNARQAGVDQARQELAQARRYLGGQAGVRVYHAAEVNRVVTSMNQGRPGLVNAVLPHTRLDLVSYSAWDSATEHFQDPNVLRRALDFIAANAPTAPTSATETSISASSECRKTSSPPGKSKRQFPTPSTRLWIGAAHTSSIGSSTATSCGPAKVPRRSKITTMSADSG